MAQSPRTRKWGACRAPAVSFRPAAATITTRISATVPGSPPWSFSAWWRCESSRRSVAARLGDGTHLPGAPSSTPRLRDRRPIPSTPRPGTHNSPASLRVGSLTPRAVIKNGIGRDQSGRSTSGTRACRAPTHLRETRAERRPLRTLLKVTPLGSPGVREWVPGTCPKSRKESRACRPAIGFAEPSVRTWLESRLLSERRVGAPLLQAAAPRTRSSDTSFVQPKPNVDKSNNRRHFVSESERFVRFFHGQQRVLERFEHTEGFFEAEKESGGTGSSLLVTPEACAMV